MIAAATLALTLLAVPAPQGADTVPVITLAEALERGTRLEPDYVEALGRVAEADWTRTAARLAFFVPAVTTSLDWTKYSQPFFNFGTLQQASTSTTFNATAQLSLNARRLVELGRSRAELEAATSTEVQRRYAAALLIESAYYTVLSDAELARVAAERLRRAEEQLVLARARVASGAAVQSDSLTVRLELVRARVDVLRQGAALRESQLELGRRAGMDGPRQAAPLDTLPPPALPLSLAEAVMQAVESGPQYRAARARERSAESALKAERTGYLPSFSITAQHNRYDVKLFPNAAAFSSLTVGVSLPIWDNGVRELNVIRARTQRDVARALRGDLERSALREVTAAYDAYETARAEVGLAEEGVVVARENYRVQEARYRAGATIVLDLLTAQTELSSAEATLVEARQAVRLARARLEAILGRRL